MDPTYLPGLIGRAQCCFLLKDYMTALTYYQSCYRLSTPMSTQENDIRLGLGACFAEVGDSERARICFQDVIDSDPTNADALYHLGVWQLVGSRVSTFSISSKRSSFFAYPSQNPFPCLIPQTFSFPFSDFHCQIIIPILSYISTAFVHFLI